MRTCRVFGRPGHEPSHCAKHRQPGMIRKPTAKCNKCRDTAIYGTNWVPKHCEEHKEADEENLVEQSCKSCGLMYILDKQGKCEVCHPESFATARLAKQNALMDYLDGRGLEGTSGACGRERPDRVYDFGDKIVVLECDENQHQERACVCEQTRMVNIGESFGGVQVYFICWNPDDYAPADDGREPELLAKRHKLCADLTGDIKTGRHNTLPVGLV
jgi:hypothetical protein